MNLTPPWGHLPWRRSHHDLEARVARLEARTGPVDHSWDRWPDDYAPADSDPGRLYGHY